MKPNFFSVLLFFLLSFSILVVGCSKNTSNISFVSNQQNVVVSECQGLSQNYADIIFGKNPVKFAQICVVSKDNPVIPNIWVGGTLASKSCKHVDWYNRTECSLNFTVLNTSGAIYFIGNSTIDSFVIGNFYKFDLSAECASIFSMASSGMFNLDYGRNILPVNC